MAQSLLVPRRAFEHRGAMQKPWRVTLVVVLVALALLFGLSRVDSSKPVRTMETDITNEANAI